MQKYKALALDDDEAVLELIVDCLKLAKCDVVEFTEAEALLSSIMELSQRALPDLIVLDLNLHPGHMQGTQLLAELLKKDVPSEMLVISGAGEVYLEEVIKMGVAVIPKPFDGIYAIVKKMEYLAETGRKRRLYRLESHDKSASMDDNTRCVRPVFLSYARKNESLAMGIRRNLESRKIPVWYAQTELKIGDPWMSRIEHAIDESNIFVAIISDGYVASKYCMLELERFHNRTVPGPNAPVILPVLAGLSESAMKHDLLKSVFDTYHYLDISERFLDRITVLLGRIEELSGKQDYGDEFSRAAGIGS